MSSKNNVNPGQYKVAGRERPGENLGQERDRQRMAKSRENYGPPRSWNQPPADLARAVQPRDTSKPAGTRGTRKTNATAPAGQAKASVRASARPAKRAAKRSEQLSGRTSRKKTAAKKT